VNNRQPQPDARPHPRLSPRPALVLSKRHRLVARIVLAWRRLSSEKNARRAGKGRPTLVACSGGADSTALVLALAAAGAPIVVAHVVHDLRPAADALADREAVRELARALSLEFVEARVSVPRGPGKNLESEARTLRYAALADLARAQSISVIATAHHADDQLESIIMGLLRGSGLRGLGGMALSRTLTHPSGQGKGEGKGDSITLIRPMLDPAAAITRADCERLCRDAGAQWRTDATNADTTRLRAAVRAKIVPQLAELRPSVRTRAVHTTSQLREAAGMLEQRAEQVRRTGGAEQRGNAPAGWSCPRSTLRRVPALVVSETLRLAYRSIIGRRGVDRLSASGLGRIARAIRDDSTDPREFALADCRVRVTARTVTIGPASSELR
jgi:tRNA(Ile)-lysidine synthase